MKRILTITLIAVTFVFANVIDAYAQRKDGVVTASSMVVTRTRIKDPIKITWQNNVEATVSLYYQASYTGGWRFGNFLYLGFGTGVIFNPTVVPWDESDKFDPSLIEGFDTERGEYKPSQIAIPLYVQMRLRFLKTKVSPYLAGTAGLLFQSTCERMGDRSFYKEGVEGLTYAEFNFGLDFKFKGGSSLYVGLGPMFSDQKANCLSDYSETEILGNIKLGYIF